MLYISSELNYAKRNLLILIVFLTCLIHIKAENPEIVSLSGIWNFTVDSLNVGNNENWKNGLPSGKFHQVKVPHTWNIDAGTEDYAGWAWYEKEVEISSDWKNRNIRLRFGAVYHDALIYVNGKKAGENRNSGYTPFTIDISDFIVCGAKNSIVVAVNNSYSETNLPWVKSFDWVNDGGITRSVQLEVTEKPSFRYIHITPVLNVSDSSGTAKITFKIWEKNVNKVRLKLTLMDINSQKIILTNEKELIAVNGEFVTSINAGRINPWHFDSPNLYELNASILTNKSISDSKTSVIGFKKVEINGEKLLLNGEEVRLPGIEYMPGSSPVYGIAEPYSYMDSVARMMKDLKVCITRFHWQQDEYMLSLMDKYGILVQEELPWWQKPAELTPELLNTAKSQLNVMIESHYNHPSIFSWGISNEVNGETNKSNYIQLRDFVKERDPNRFVTVVSNRIWQKKNTDESLLCDIPTWNEYIGTWHANDRSELIGLMDTVKNAIGNRPLLITENGLCEPAITGGDARRIDDMLFHIKEWKKHPFTIGYIYFCLSDYRTHVGEEGFGKYKIRRHGITDVYLQPKPSYSVFKQINSPIEITKVERVSNTASLVELKNKNDIPSYTIRGYILRYKNQKDECINVKLPVLKPGSTFSVNLENINAQFQFDVIDPNGFVVINY